MNTYEQNAHTYTGPGPCTVLIPNEEGELEACGWTSASNPIHQPMTWAVGRDLGVFCGQPGCRNTPRPYRQSCEQHDRRPQMAIWFDIDKHGKRIAYRWSMRQFRSFRIGVAEAELLIATGEGCLVPERPFAKAVIR